ncbi:hypothetical protein D3C87_1275330 [compost metagenome]
MAFILTDKPRLHRLECETPTGSVFYLTFRELTEDERGKFDLEHAKCRHRPGDAPEESSRRFDLLLSQTAAALMADWEGIEDEDGNPIDLTDEARRSFVKDDETRKYWRPYIFRYLWPQAREVDAKKAREAKVSSLVLEGEQSLDPQFY